MDFANALTYIFEDRQWARKLIPLACFSFLALIPVIGLLALALVLGFVMQTAAHVREGLPRPLPLWDDYAQKFTIGGNLLGAVILYHLPVIVAGSCSTWLLTTLGSGFLGSSVAWMALCCTLPLLLAYTALVWALLAIGAAEYIETGEARRMFQLRHLWDVLGRHQRLALQWVFFALLTTLAAVLLLAIPCLGWSLALLFLYPVYAHLLGQFAHRLALTNKPRARKRPA